MGKEDRFMASMARLDGKAKFIHNSFSVNSIGQKLTLDSLISKSSKEKEIAKSYEKTIVAKKKTDRLSEVEANPIEVKKTKRKGAYEVNKEKVSDWDSTIQKRRLAKSYDFTNHTSSQPLETIEVASKKFKIETPLEAEISSLLYGGTKAKSDEEVKNSFMKDQSKDLRNVKKHLAEIAKARTLARRKEEKDRHQSKIKSKRYRRALRKRKQELVSKETEDSKVEIEKADFKRAEERATLRHKTVSKKLRFYDQTNTKESEVRRTQNLASQKLREKRAGNDSDSDDSEKNDENGDSEDEIMQKTAKLIKDKASTTQKVTKRINPDDFVQTEIKDFEAMEDTDDEDQDEKDAFSADVTSFDSGIDVEKKENEDKTPKVLPGWGSWSSDLPKVKKPKLKKKPDFKRSLVLKDGKKFLADHQLMTVPHPYKNFDDCQSDLSQPVGDTFVPKTTVMKTTKPKVHVKLGAKLEADQKDE